jgi:hypothetical protein
VVLVEEGVGAIVGLGVGLSVEFGKADVVETGCPFPSAGI